jgi:hypothetical protein
MKTILALVCLLHTSSMQRYKLRLTAQTLTPGYHLIGSRVETRCLSAMGQGESTCLSQAPPGTSAERRYRSVAVQVEFESKL